MQGVGYTTGAAAGDFDNDGREDLFVAGVQRNQLLRNRGDGTFEDVTAKAGITNYTWSVAAGWFDFDNDGWLDLFIVNYVDWTPETNKFCGDRARDLRVYCHPKHYRGLANALYRNRHDGTFEDVSAKSGIGAQVGKGMSVAFADYDGDGFTDIFVTNDAVPDFLFHNRGNGTFEEVGLLAGVAVPAHGRPVSSMGTDFRDSTTTAGRTSCSPPSPARRSRSSRTTAGSSFATRPTRAGWARQRPDEPGGARRSWTSTTTASRIWSRRTRTPTTGSRSSSRAATVRPTASSGTRTASSGRLRARRAGLRGGPRQPGHRRRRFRRRRPARSRHHRARRRRATAAQRQRRRPPRWITLRLAGRRAAATASAPA